MNPEKTQELNQLHARAMELADMAKFDTDTDRTLLLYRAALEYESRVAEELFCTDLEPSRSIILRSAASLALQCGEIDSAERFAAQGLGGRPEPVVAQGLRDMIFEVNLRRSIDTHFAVGVPSKMHVTFAGPHATPNSIEPRLFATHMETLHSMMFRVYENLLGNPFRESGRRRSRSIQDDVVFRYEAASNGVFGYDLSAQRVQEKFGFADNGENVVQSTANVLRWASSGDRNQLLRFCNDNRDYYRYFVHGTKGLLPDGRKVRQIGFMTDSDSAEPIVVGTATRDVINRRMVYDEDAAEHLEIRGYLDRANRRSSTIAIRDEEGQTHNLQIQGGITAKMLGRLWDTEVIAYASVRKGNTLLESIEPADS
jgi:hypothetical protein